MSAAPQWRVQVDEVAANLGRLGRFGVTVRESQHHLFHRDRLAVELLYRAHRIRGLGILTELWEDWEAWFADLEESHTSLAALVTHTCR